MLIWAVGVIFILPLRVTVINKEDPCLTLFDIVNSLHLPCS
jgi:hypothetical protein